MVVHGLLHLCGQRDKTPRTERQMHRKEDKYLRFWETPQSDAADSPRAAPSDGADLPHGLRATFAIPNTKTDKI